MLKHNTKRLLTIAKERKKHNNPASRKGLAEALYRVRGRDRKARLAGQKKSWLN